MQWQCYNWRPLVRFCRVYAGAQHPAPALGRVSPSLALAAQRAGIWQLVRSRGSCCRGRTVLGHLLPLGGVRQDVQQRLRDGGLVGGVHHLNCKLVAQSFLFSFLYSFLYITKFLESDTRLGSGTTGKELLKFRVAQGG